MRITATHIRQAAAERSRRRWQSLEEVALQLANVWRARGRRETRRVVGAGGCACGPTREHMKRADLHVGATLLVHEHEVSPRRKTEVGAEREVDASLGALLGRRLQYAGRYARAAHAGPCLHKAQPPVAVHGHVTATVSLATGLQNTRRALAGEYVACLACRKWLSSELGS